MQCLPIAPVHWLKLSGCEKPSLIPISLQSNSVRDWERVRPRGLRFVPRAASAGVQGNRFSIIYPEVLQGHSIAMAMTFGYIAGTNAAMGV